MDARERRTGLIVLLVAFALFEVAIQAIVSSKDNDPPPAAMAALAGPTCLGRRLVLHGARASRPQ
jgi:hypothetical protein